MAAKRLQPWRINTVMGGGRTEIPQMRLAVAAQHREAAEFIARPLADCRRSYVADIVVVEAQQRAERGIANRLPGASQRIAGRPPKIDALLEVDIHDPMRVEARPIVMGIDIFGPDLEAFGDRGLGRFIARDLAVLLLLVTHELHLTAIVCIALNHTITPATLKDQPIGGAKCSRLHVDASSSRVHRAGQSWNGGPDFGRSVKRFAPIIEHEVLDYCICADETV